MSQGSKRSYWKLVCLASLAVAIVLRVISESVAVLLREASGSDWFKIANGLLALIELTCWTTAGIGGIGWVLSRRPTASPSSSLKPRGGA